jgi:hypothetical protein
MMKVFTAGERLNRDRQRACLAKTHISRPAARVRVAVTTGTDPLSMKLTRFTSILLAMVSLLSATFVDVEAAIVTTIEASKDNTIFEEFDDITNGGGSGIFVGKTGMLNGFNLRRGLIAFDIAAAGIPANAIVSAVTVTMFLVKDNDLDPLSISLHLARQNWGEGTAVGIGSGAPASQGDATWGSNFFDISPWTTPGGNFRSTSSATTVVDDLGRDYFWNAGSLVADVQAWINDSTTNFGWFIIGGENRNQSARYFSSREDSEASHLPPRLTITYTIPEPSIVLLGLAGCYVLFGRRRPEVLN